MGADRIPQSADVRPGDRGPDGHPNFLGRHPGAELLRLHVLPLPGVSSLLLL